MKIHNEIFQEDWDFPSQITSQVNILKARKHTRGINLFFEKDGKYGSLLFLKDKIVQCPVKNTPELLGAMFHNEMLWELAKINLIELTVEDFDPFLIEMDQIVLQKLGLIK